MPKPKSIPVVPGMVAGTEPEPGQRISAETRRRWNTMLKRLGIGKIVQLDHRDLPWLLEIGAVAVAKAESES